MVWVGGVLCPFGQKGPRNNPPPTVPRTCSRSVKCLGPFCQKGPRKVSYDNALFLGPFGQKGPKSLVPFGQKGPRNLVALALSPAMGEVANAQSFRCAVLAQITNPHFVQPRSQLCLGNLVQTIFISTTANG